MHFNNGGFLTAPLKALVQKLDVLILEEQLGPITSRVGDFQRATIADPDPDPVGSLSGS